MRVHAIEREIVRGSFFLRPLRFVAEAFHKHLARPFPPRREPDLFERSLPPLRYSRYLEEQNRAERVATDRMRLCPKPGRTTAPPHPKLTLTHPCDAAIWPRLGDVPPPAAPAPTAPTPPPAHRQRSAITGRLIDVIA